MAAESQLHICKFYIIFKFPIWNRQMGNYLCYLWFTVSFPGLQITILSKLLPRYKVSFGISCSNIRCQEQTLVTMFYKERFSCLQQTSLSVSWLPFCALQQWRYQHDGNSGTYVCVLKASISDGMEPKSLKSFWFGIQLCWPSCSLHQYHFPMLSIKVLTPLF